MNKHEEMAVRIIKEQELIMGPIAWAEAGRVPGISATPADDAIGITGDPLAVLDLLVAQYERLFGRAAREACRDAVASIVADLTPSEIPASLRSA
jgi:hypothetical protein